jgi:hypothetical protein
MPVAGNVYRNAWTVLDPTGTTPVGGLTSPADVALTLLYDNGTTIAAAAESVSWAATSVTGTYVVAFTPNTSGRYILSLQELNAGTMQRQYRFSDIEVLSAGAVFIPSYASAFCSEADIERWVQTSIDSNSDPNDSETAGFAEARASLLQSMCLARGTSVTPMTVTNGSRIQDILREANAIGAALDYTIAQTFAVSPSKTDRIGTLQAMWEQYTGTAKADGYLQIEIKAAGPGLATDYIVSGDTQPADAQTVQDIGITFGMGSVW